MKSLLMLAAVSSVYFSLPFIEISKKEEPKQVKTLLDEIKSLNYFNEIDKMLQTQGASINPAVASRVLLSLQCADQQQVNHNHILALIDYSLPSSQKRLWVFDLDKKQLLFHTYVSHGINSGATFTNHFSNKNNSKASSLGVFTTENSYYGRDGLSLRLDGLEKGFNDKANARYIVIHGGWYVNEGFIRKYGRAGRSWGCPALPLNNASDIINTIKDNAFLVVYYPDDAWFFKSRFLNCKQLVSRQSSLLSLKPPFKEDNAREAILFLDLNKNDRFEETEPVLTLNADKYMSFFKKPAPLERMLRRQINFQEYIVLNPEELKAFVSQNALEKGIQLSALSTETAGKDFEPNAVGLNPAFNDLYFVVPVVKNSRGYYKTEMHFVSYGKIMKVEPDNAQIIFSEKTVNLNSTRQFIRWLGL